MNGHDQGRFSLTVLGLTCATALACGAPDSSVLPGPIATSPPSDPTVAVLPLHQAAGDPSWAGLGPGLAGVVTSELSTVPGIVLVERSRLDALVAEIELGDAGYLDPATASEMGRGIGAQLVVVGSYSVLPDELALDARLVRVSTGEVVAAGAGRAPIDDWDAASTEVVEALAAGLGASASPSDPAASLEDVRTFGRGIDAERQGDRQAAQQAYTDARALPLAAQRLQGLEATLAQARADLDAVQDRFRREALDTLPPDTAHRGRPTRAERIDATLRWAVLAAEGQWCALAAEQEHFLERNGWRGSGIAPWDTERRAKSLQLLGDEEVDRLLVSGHTSDTLYGADPIDVRSGWLFAVGRCEDTLGPVLGAWQRAIEAVPAGQIDGDPVKLDLQAGRAWLIARHTGAVPASFVARVEASGTRHAVERGEEVARAATDFALRGGLTDAGLLAFADGVRNGDPSVIDTSDAVCRSWAWSDAKTLGRYADTARRDGMDGGPLENIGSHAWLYDVRGCRAGRPATYPDSAAILAEAQRLVATPCGEGLSVDLEVSGEFLKRGMAPEQHERTLLLGIRRALRCP